VQCSRAWERGWNAATDSRGRDRTTKQLQPFARSRGYRENCMKTTGELERIYADWEQRVIEEFEEETWQQGMRQSFALVYELRFETMPEELHDALGRVQDSSTLGRLSLVCVMCAQETVIELVRQAAGMS
jgi:hypothetical protein